MVKNFTQRLAKYREDMAEEKWLSEMNGGLAYQVHCLMQEYEWEAENGIRGIRPNRLGCWLLVALNEIHFKFKAARYVFLGRDPDYWEYELFSNHDPIKGGSL